MTLIKILADLNMKHNFILYLLQNQVTRISSTAFYLTLHGASIISYSEHALTILRELACG